MWVGLIGLLMFSLAACSPPTSATDASAPDAGLDGGLVADDAGVDAVDARAPDCGPHGSLHGDHCDCDEGFRPQGAQCVPVAECAADEHEPNDRLEQATALSAARALRGRRCAGDLDLFRVRVEQGQRLVATLRFAHSDGDLDLWLFEPGRTPLVDRAIARGESADDDEQVAHRARVTGDFALAVVGGAPSAQCEYAIDVRIEP